MSLFFCFWIVLSDFFFYKICLIYIYLFLLFYLLSFDFDIVSARFVIFLVAYVYVHNPYMKFMCEYLSVAVCPHEEYLCYIQLSNKIDLKIKMCDKPHAFMLSCILLYEIRISFCDSGNLKFT